MKMIIKKVTKWVTRIFFGLILCKTCSYIILPIVFIFHRRYVPLRKKIRQDRNSLAIIINIIPDISHHFIYREVASLKKNFDLRLFSIERGDDQYATPLTRYLQEDITYFPALASGSQYPKYYLAFLKYLFLHPIKASNLLLLFEKNNWRRALGFVDHATVLNMVHPVYGFYLAHLIEKQSVGHIHAYCTTKTSNFALVAAHMLDIGFSINSYVDFDFPAPYKLLDEKLELCDFDVVHTMFCKERLLSYTSEKYRSKIHVIRFGLTLDEFIPREKSDSMKLRLLCIGNLVPKKGHRFLIKACEVLRDKGVDFELLIVGAGVMRPQLEELVAFLNLQDRIRFVGGVPNDKVADFLTPDAILVVPSIYAIDGERDGMPTIISEAMVMGTPVISTYVSGIPEVIKNGVNGLLVPPEDSNSLADAIVKLAGDTKLREDLIKNGRETVKELFDHRKWIPEIVKLLHQSLAGDI